MSFRRTLTTAIAALTLTAAANAQYPLTPDEIFGETNLYGINRFNGSLYKYNFSAQQLTNVGHVTNSSGTILTGINGGAYIPGFQQLHAFWTDPSDSQTKLLLTNVDTAYASLDVMNLGTGIVTGSVSHTYEEPSAIPGIDTVTRFKLYALQMAIGVGDGMSGGININPNNSPQMEFEMTYTVNATGTELTITRDELHKNATTTPDGILIYNGVTINEDNVTASYIRVKPKGNGNQNGLVINGAPYAVSNGTVYTIASDYMQVRLQNSNIKNNKAMGHWWIDITAGTGTVTPGSNAPITFSPAPVSKLIQTDTQTKDINDIWTLSRVYQGLATKDAQTFYATSGSGLYLINVATGSETLVNTLSSPMNFGLEFCNGHLITFEVAGNHIIPVNALNGSPLTAPINVTGLSELGTIIFASDRELGTYD